MFVDPLGLFLKKAWELAKKGAKVVKNLTKKAASAVGGAAKSVGSAIGGAAKAVGKALKGAALIGGSFTQGVSSGVWESLTAGLSNKLGQSLNMQKPYSSKAHTIGKIVGNLAAGIGGTIVGSAAAMSIPTSGGASAAVGAPAVAVGGASVAVSSLGALVENAVLLAAEFRGGGNNPHNWGNKETLEGHLEKHKEFGAVDEEDYARQANEFFNNRGNHQVKVDKYGIIRVY